MEEMSKEKMNLEPGDGAQLEPVQAESDSGAGSSKEKGPGGKWPKKKSIPGPPAGKPVQQQQHNTTYIIVRSF